jgi:myosin-5
LVSVNPYEHLPIYTHQLLKQYAGQRMGVLPPHIFAVANAAYSALVADKRNQSVIIRYYPSALFESNYIL